MIVLCPRVLHAIGVLLLLAALAARVDAQQQPATIPTVVARTASAFLPLGGAPPEFFDHALPRAWPAELVPTGAAVLGGSMYGDESMFRLQAAVFDFTGTANPDTVLRSLLLGAGYTSARSRARAEGGFLASPSEEKGALFCKGNAAVGFGRVDSLPAPPYYSMIVIEGEAGRQTCTESPSRMHVSRFPVDVPTLRAPAGGVQVARGQSQSGDEGVMSAFVRTSLEAEATLAHYTAQLVAGGWTADGRPAIGAGVAAQRFTIRADDEPRLAVFTVIAGEGQHDLQLLVKRPR